jgi:VIT1/CCC1 family predicted Fe2+/Mn2+ transporter
MARGHHELHRSHRAGWLRAAVLGANDGIISVASLAVGVAASGASSAGILLATVAGTVAGAMSMAAGEYVSVQSQADTEAADLAIERRELAAHPARELAELTAIYVDRGLDEPLARQVATKLSDDNALEAHARDELGITETMRARPIQAALASAAAFTVGSVVPVLTVLVSPAEKAALATSATAVLMLLILGGAAAAAGGARVGRGAARVAVWGVLAMGASAAVGQWFGASI